VRVLLVADVVGGAGTFVGELTRALTVGETEVHLALLGPLRRRSEFQRLRASSCELRDLRLEWMEEPWADVEAVGEWVEELRELHRPDLIHMNTFAPVLSRAVPVLLTVHSCVLTWWRAVHGRPAPAAWARYERLARAAIERAELTVTPTRALLSDLVAVYERLPGARVIPNGRSVRQTDRPGADRQRLVVSAGRLWDEAKNVDLLAQAAGAIHGRVAVIGPGRVSGVDALGALDSSAVLNWFSRAAVFAEPARYEPFGLAALEAALCGCALVLGDIPSLREVWGEAATFVSPHDADALVHAVNRLLDDRILRQEAARRALAAAARFSPSEMASAYSDAYRQLVAAGAPA